MAERHSIQQPNSRCSTGSSSRKELRNRHFDFEKLANGDFTETVSMIAHLSGFIIADLNNPKSILQELTAIVPRHVPVPVWLPQDLEPLHCADESALIDIL